MAFVTNMSDEDKKDQQGGPVSPGGAGNTIQTSPGSGVGAVGGTSTSGGAPQSGGQFASLNQYVNANQGQAAPLSGQITSGIGQQYNQLQNQNQNVLSGISGQVDKGYTKQNQDILSQESQNPVSFASNPTNIQSFQGQLNDKYTGPQNAESTGEYSGQLANVNNAISQGNAQVGTDTGRQQLLRQYEKAPTAGVTGLNSAILAQDPNAQKNIEQAYQPFSNLVSGLQTGAQGINTQIGNAQNEAQNASQTANKQIQDQVSGLNTNVGNELKTATGQYQKYTDMANNLGSTLQQGKLEGASGVDQGLQDFMQNNINPWVSQYAPGQSVSYNFANAIPQLANVSAPTLANAATQQDMDAYNALNQLSGTQQASPLQGLALSSPFKAPTMPTVDNKALAGDIYSGLSHLPANVSSNPYHQYLDLLASLNNYQGLPNTGGPFGPGYGGSKDPYGNTIPTIS